MHRPQSLTAIAVAVLQRPGGSAQCRGLEYAKALATLSYWVQLCHFGLAAQVLAAYGVVDLVASGSQIEKIRIY